ncbi:MAG: hypothetical protein J0L60_14195 [Ignavibacteria bacterium]|nr:hypothetical protein [Ignavibacteria bacterium]
MNKFRSIPFFLSLLLFTPLYAQESIIISLHKVDSTDYYIILEKNVNLSELWLREKPFAKSNNDIKLAVIETKLTKEASKLVVRQHHHLKNNMIDAGRAQPLGSGVASVIGTDNELLPVCMVFLTPNMNQKFVKFIDEDGIIIADNFKKFDYGDPKEVTMKGLIPSDLAEVAIAEACKDYSVSN